MTKKDGPRLEEIKQFAVRVQIPENSQSHYFDTMPAAMYCFWVAVNKAPAPMYKLLFDTEVESKFVGVYEQTTEGKWVVVKTTQGD